MFVTSGDFMEYLKASGQTLADGQAARLDGALAQAERFVKVKIGAAFYDEADRAADASQDWIYVACVVADYLMGLEGKEQRAMLSSAEIAVQVGPQTLTMRRHPALELDVWQDWRIRDLVAYYTATSGGENRISQAWSVTPGRA